jgi:hypothetical protein
MRRSVGLDESIPSDEPRFVNVKSLDSSTAGGDDSGPIVGPEEKAAETRGQSLTGKITLDQYDLLVGSCFDGEVVMHWTAHHADKVIRERGLRPRAKAGAPAAPAPTLIACEKRGVKVSQKNMQRHLRRVHKVV